MGKIIAIDPGPKTSGVAIIDDASWPPLIRYAGKTVPIVAIMRDIERTSSMQIYPGACDVVVEDITARGAGHSIFTHAIQTAKIMGEISRQCTIYNTHYHEINGATWRAKVTGNPTAKTTQIKDCISEIYEEAGFACGGGKNPVKGTKLQPGPLYGVASHAWDAIGIGLAWIIINEGKIR